MTEKLTVETFFNDNDELWGVFVRGHVPPSSIVDTLNDGRADYDIDPIEANQIKQAYMCHAPEVGGGEDYPWVRCDGTAAGAVPVTGYFP